MVPLVVDVVLLRVRKSRLVADIVQSTCWIRDILGSLSILVLAQSVSLWSIVQGLQLIGEPERMVHSAGTPTNR
jgi:hypothetical protein